MTMTQEPSTYSSCSAVPKRFRAASPDDLRGDLKTWDKTNGLYLYGPVGTGKTHQAAALLNAFGSAFTEYIVESAHYGIGHHSSGVHWWNACDLLEAIRRSFTTPETAPRPESNPLLVIDDLGSERPTEWVRERLYSIVNSRYEAMLPTIVTSNLSLNEIGDQIGQRTASRLSEMCDVYCLNGTDRRSAKQTQATKRQGIINGDTD